LTVLKLQRRDEGRPATNREAGDGNEGKRERKESEGRVTMGY
jgi:hypothetical protein